MTNEQLLAAWTSKLPAVEATDRDLSAFALGVEVGQATLQERLSDALFVLGMVDKNNRIDAGEKGKAWSGRFVVEEVRRVLALGPNVRVNLPATRAPQE